MVGWLVCLLVGWFVCLLVGWLVGWLIGWLVGSHPAYVKPNIQFVFVDSLTDLAGVARQKVTWYIFCYQNSLVTTWLNDCLT